MAPRPPQMTLEQFLKLPERKPALEVENGRVTQKAIPLGQHSALQGTVAQLVNQYARPRHLGYAFIELRTTFAGMSRVPEVAVYRMARIPRDVSGEVADDFWEPPDVAIEIMSPNQLVELEMQRCFTLVESGVAVALLVDPTDRTIRTIRRNQAPSHLQNHDHIDLTDLLPGLILSVQEIFDGLYLK